MKRLQINKRKAMKYYLFLLLWGLSFYSYSQVKYKNALLSELAVQLSTYGITEDFTGERYVDALCKDKPVIVHRGAHGVIDHIGIKLFERDIISKHPSPIYYFVERYLLELLLSDNDKAIQERLKRERVRITSEVYSLASYKRGINDIISAFSPDQSVYITCNNNRYSVVCTNDRKTVLSFSFPVRYELITGDTKLEAENSIYWDLLVHNRTTPVPVSSSDLSEYKDSIYSANDDYYVMENIISTSYYQKEQENYIPLFSVADPVESIYNLFNSKYDWNVEAEITQSLYGSKTNTFTTRVAQLTDYLRSRKCSLYTGIRKMEKDKIEGVVMAVNMELGYQHIMTFTLDKGLLQAPEKYNVKIKMYSYVPIHNISSLFGENKTK